MTNKELAKELETRTKKFAINIIMLSTSMPSTPAGKVIRNQITKSGTSIGANYREANKSGSPADFACKIKICTSEKAYWLEIISELGWFEDLKSETELKEANELLAIFTSIGKNLKN